MYIYSDENRESETYALPDIEIFYVDKTMADEWNEYNNDWSSSTMEMTDYTPGYYYQFCFPGCLPDSEPYGPYETEEDAIEAAREE